MNKALLKISKKMYEDIQLDRKNVEIRKLNKDYIQQDMEVQFVDMGTGKFLGWKTVLSKVYIKPSDIRNITQHQPTIDFVKENYKDELVIVAFYLGDL